MRRARGNGGRFLNTKKLEGNNSNATPEKGSNNGANPSKVSGSSLTNHHQYDASQSMAHAMQKVQSFTIDYRDSNGMSSLYHSQLNGKNEGQCFGGEMQSMQMHGAPDGAIE